MRKAQDDELLWRLRGQHDAAGNLSAYNPNPQPESVRTPPAHPHRFHSIRNGGDSARYGGDCDDGRTTVGSLFAGGLPFSSNMRPDQGRGGAVGKGGQKRANAGAAPGSSSSDYELSSYRSSMANHSVRF